MPPWLNMVFGLVMAIVGIIFFLTQGKGESMVVRVVLLVAYLALAAFYFGKGFRNYRRRNPV